MPFFNVNVVDINTIICSLYQDDQTLRETISKLKTDTNYEQCNDTIEKLKMIITLRETENNKISDALDNMRMTGKVATNKKTILDNLNQHSNNDFLDVNYMVPIFNSYSNIINFYSEVVEIFDNNMKDMPMVATDTRKMLIVIVL